MFTNAQDYVTGSVSVDMTRSCSLDVMLMQTPALVHERRADMKGDGLSYDSLGLYNPKYWTTTKAHKLNTRKTMNTNHPHHYFQTRNG